MIPYIQTNTSKTEGNCWQTAVASVIEFPIDKVPHFVGHDDIGAVESWYTYTWEWLYHHGYDLRPQLRHLYTGEYYLACGYTERETYHVCIYRNGKMVHDPHPTGVGLLNVKEYYTVRLR